LFFLSTQWTKSRREEEEPGRRDFSNFGPEDLLRGTGGHLETRNALCWVLITHGRVTSYVHARIQDW
jgi:hypothetical protein